MIPCENCITLAICNSLYLEYHRLEGVFITNLKRKCSILNGYLYEPPSFAINYGETDPHEANSYEVIKFFKQKNRGYLTMEDRRMNQQWNLPVKTVSH